MKNLTKKRDDRPTTVPPTVPPIYIHTFQNNLRLREGGGTVGTVLNNSPIRVRLYNRVVAFSRNTPPLLCARPVPEKNAEFIYIWAGRCVPPPPIS